MLLWHLTTCLRCSFVAFCSTSLFPGVSLLQCVPRCLLYQECQSQRYISSGRSSGVFTRKEKSQRDLGKLNLQMQSFEAFTWINSIELSHFS